MKISVNRLKKRIRFLTNFQKTTKSISLISVIRFQKSFFKIKKIMKIVIYYLEIFKDLLKLYPESFNLLNASDQQLNNKNLKTLVIAITSDRGLSGSFDQIIFKKTEKLIDNLEKSQKNILLGVIGKKGVNYFSKKYSLIFSFKNFENFLPENLAQELLNYLNFLIEKEKINEIWIVRSNLTATGFEAENVLIYPYRFEDLENLINKVIPKMKEWESFQVEEKISTNYDYLFEPSLKKVKMVLIKNIFYLLIYVLILESQASLELTRTITMKKASDNAKKLKEKNVLEYNKLRQQKITEELIDLLRT
jgi:F-type H+-transporting ATPase subunit gamma